ncbi:MAG: MiaB/RimO family radical SAM methylthiotransferase, partial [Rikenellaceae bacterium]|nr:MiaB/RimO family radical SAM methylthiotransferase [Rikenellaceae bacterium]
ADKKCRNIVRRCHTRNPQAIIAVTGCYAQLKPHEIAAIEGVDIVLSNRSKADLFDEVMALGARSEAKVLSCETAELTNFFAAFSQGDRTRSFLKVQDGCDYKCAYCTIHYARGSSRNAPIAQLVEEAREIAASGVREIVLTGINVGDFGHSTGESFIDLIRALDTVEGIDRYRISSIEPNLLTDEVAEFCAASSKFQPHFHIPIQSGCDTVLERMGRRYNTERFADRIAKVRSLMPDTFFGIDVIVGFPGETDEEFEATYSLLESLHPAYLHIFPFSARPGTPAYSMKDQVKASVKTERAARLDELCQRLHREFCLSQVGRTLPVLFENASKNGLMTGFTGNYVKVAVPYDKSLANTIVDVTLTEDNIVL